MITTQELAERQFDELFPDVEHSSVPFDELIITLTELERDMQDPEDTDFYESAFAMIQYLLDEKESI